jgi:asparagine synthase (glutamine-hydrolysing)
MCGIAGLVRLSGRDAVPAGMLQRMANALTHRGPDDDGYFERSDVGFANRRLSIVGLTDGRQPIGNEDGSVVTVFNGELFDHRRLRHALEANGHRFATHCDTEVIPHLWEDHQEDIFARLCGQFAFALYDDRRRRVILARDRFGIIPLYWSRQKSSDGEWLLFASEIKALLASGMVHARPDLRGIDQVFHFFAVPGPATCFEGVQALQPGHFLSIDLHDRDAARVEERVYWAMDFPDQGQEDDYASVNQAVDAFERVLLDAVERRLRADVPVVSYLSGGIDSSIVAAMAAKIRGAATPAFTVQVHGRRFDESDKAAIVARHIGARAVVISVGSGDVVRTYPELIRATEAPVIDTAAAATLLLAREVHNQGFKVALAGEGADEWLAGYPWHKVHRLVGLSDGLPGVHLSPFVRRLMCAAVGATARGTRAILGSERVLGHHSAFHYVYGLMTASRYLFFSDETLASLEDHDPYLELRPDLDRMRRWHWISQAAYWAGRIHLPGHLLSLKGDRPAMRSSVETRYPFLDEDVFDFLARLPPRWKMRGLRDKYILRLLGERYLPHEIAWRRKVMFRAPLDSFFAPANGETSPYVDQLLSEDSLKRTRVFNIDQVRLWRRRMQENRISRTQRTVVQLGLVGVLSTQLWYHTFIESLADLPTEWTGPRPERAGDRGRPAPNATLATSPT